MPFTSRLMAVWSGYLTALPSVERPIQSANQGEDELTLSASELHLAPVYRRGWNR